MEGVERTNIVIVSPNKWTGFMPSKENQGGKNKNKKEKKEEKKNKKKRSKIRRRKEKKEKENYGSEEDNKEIGNLE